MGWFRSTLKVLQKERGVPFEKASKISEHLKKNMAILNGAIVGEGKAESVQLQRALALHYEKQRLLSIMQKDLASRGEGLAVEEKVASQLMGMKDFVKNSMNFLKTDWDKTKKDMSQVKLFAQNQIKNLEIFQQHLLSVNAYLQKPRMYQYTTSSTGKERGKMIAAANLFQSQIDDCHKVIAQLKGQKGKTNFSQISDSISSLYAEFQKSIGAFTLPEIDRVSAEDAKAYLQVSQNQISAIAEACAIILKEQKHLKEIGVPPLKTARLNRAIRELFAAAA